MSEGTEKALLEIFNRSIDDINKANDKLRKWMYGFIAIFGIGLLSSVYWAGTISQRVDNIDTNVTEITKQVSRIEAKYSDIVWFMIAEFQYKPSVRELEPKN